MAGTRAEFRLFFLMAAIFCQGPGARADGYQLIGTIIQKDRGFSRNALPVVLLDGTAIPYASVTKADLSGRFKFKNLQPDMYTVTVYIPRVGEHRKTVEVGPSLADPQKRIFLDLNFKPNLGSKAMHEVTSVQLSVPSKALKEYEKALKRLGRSDAAGAIVHLKKTVEIAPHFPEAWNTMGMLAYKSGDFLLAESYFREALKHDPNYYASVVNLGGALLSQGKAQESISWNMDALRARPDDALAHSQLGLCYFYLGQYPEAERYLRQAASLDPAHFSYPQLTLAKIYLHKKDYAASARELGQFLSLHPDAEKLPAIQKQIEALRSLIPADLRP